MLTKSLRRRIRGIFRNLGFQRRIAPDFVEVMQELEINVVLDVGANEGQYAIELRDRGYDGQIVSFEPNPEVFERLKKNSKNDNNWDCVCVGVADKPGTLAFSIGMNDTMSSFKSLTSFGEDSGAQPVEKIDVRVTTIDEFLSQNPKYLGQIYLKIDTQGFEYEVIQGSKNSLKIIKSIQAEIALLHTYANEIDWIEFLVFMRKERFELATAICNSRHNAQIREFDLVFNNKN